MKYIRTFESFKGTEKMNEEFLGLGKLFKNLKNKLSLGFSKMFGTAKAADKVMEDYKKERLAIENEKTAAVKALAEYLKGQSSGAQKDDAKKKELENNLTKQNNLYAQKVELVKKKFDIKIKDATADEKNEKIKNYVDLKKIEMELEFISNELKVVQEDLGLTDEIIKGSPVFKTYMDNLGKKATDGNAAKQKEVAALKGDAEGGDKKEDPGAFDIEEAKKNKDYAAKDSQFAKGTYKFALGEEIKIFLRETSQDVDSFKKLGNEYKGTTAYVFARRKEDTPDKLRIGYKPDTKEKDTITFPKSKIVTTKKIEDEKAKAKESQEKKEGQEKKEV
jgi:hypothetical protein